MANYLLCLVQLHIASSGWGSGMDMEVLLPPLTTAGVGSNIVQTSKFEVFFEGMFGRFEIRFGPILHTT